MIFCFHLHAESLFIFKCIQAYSLNYVFIMDSFHLDGYYIDYMSSGNHNYYDPVRGTYI